MLNTLSRWVRRRPRVAIALVAGGALGAAAWLSSRPTPPGGTPKPAAPLGEGRLLTPEVELRGVVKHLQEDNAILRKSVDDLTRALQELKQRKPGPDAGLSPSDLERLKRELGPLPSLPVSTPPPATLPRLLRLSRSHGSPSSPSASPRPHHPSPRPGGCICPPGASPR